MSRRVRLGERMSEENRLHTAALLRAFDTLQLFKTFCKAQGIRQIIPVATAAVRDASNGADFLAMIRKNVGLDFRVLSGEEEAYYGTLGVVNGLGLNDGLIMDIGGGSAEISVVRDGTFVQGTTTALGAVRCTEVYLPGPIAQMGDVQRLREAAASAFQAIDWMRLRKNAVFVGLGGTVRQLARMDRHALGYPYGLVNGYELRLHRLEKIIGQLQASPLTERTTVFPSLLGDRADIILAGAVVIAEAMRRARATRLRVSGQGLREGLFYELFFRGKAQTTQSSLRQFSVMNVARLYGYEAEHTAHVARLALSLFDQLKPIHGYGEAEREYLWAAAILHDIGTVIDYYDHHKHSAYIILNAGLPGFSHREAILIAQMCQYHRKGKPSLVPFGSILKKDDEVRITRLSALLRLAEFLDRSRAQTVTDVRVNLDKGQALIMVIPKAPGGASVEIWEALLHVDLFESAYGLSVEIEEI